jgi:hypothetical protein
VSPYSTSSGLARYNPHTTSGCRGFGHASLIRLTVETAKIRGLLFRIGLLIYEYPIYEITNSAVLNVAIRYDMNR